MDDPIWNLFGAAIQLQQRRRERPDAIPDDFEAIAREIETSLAALEAQLPPLDAISSLRSQVAYALEESDRERACALLEEAIASNLSGFSIRTRDNPFGFVAADATIDTAVAAKAEELGRDPRRIFEFVATQIGHALYQGNFRAPAEVLSDGVGNDADMSGLLVELLRASDIEARLVSGPMRLTRATASACLDIADEATVERCLRDAGYTVMSWDDTLDVIEHFRVRALIDDAWIDLDPCVRPLEIVEQGTRIDTPWREMDYLSDPNATRGPLAFYESAVSSGGTGASPVLRNRQARAPVPPLEPLQYETPGFPANKPPSNPNNSTPSASSSPALPANSSNTASPHRVTAAT